METAPTEAGGQRDPTVEPPIDLRTHRCRHCGEPVQRFAAGWFTGAGDPNCTAGRPHEPAAVLVEQLTPPPIEVRRRGRPRKYPWDEWFNGERHVLNSVTHFPGITVISMRQQVLNEAAKRGYEVATKTAQNPQGDGTDYLEVKPKPAAPKKRMNWDAFFAQVALGLAVVVEKDKHFDCSAEAMRVRIYQAAQRRTLRVITELHGDAITVYPGRDEPVTETAPEEGA